MTRDRAAALYPVAVTGRRDPRPWVDALSGSHDRLSDMVGALGPDGLRDPSYCDDWTISQVLSHLGSGAEIFQATLDAVAAGDPPPGRERYSPIWDRWNAMTPEEQAAGFLSTDGALVEGLARLGDELAALQFVVFDSLHIDAAGFVGMRLSEHALHAWDVAVMLDPSATVDPAAVALLVDRLPQMADRIGHADAAGAARPLEVAIDTTAPARRFVLRVDDEVLLSASDATGGAEQLPGGSPGGADTGAAAALQLPAEALLRLVYGRLDPARSPVAVPDDLVAVPHDLVDRLQEVFPGF